MAQGFESKFVQSQQEVEAPVIDRRDGRSRGELQMKKHRESLERQRRRLQRDLDTAHNERYRETVRAALKHIEGEIARLTSS